MGIATLDRSGLEPSHDCGAEESNVTPKTLKLSGASDPARLIEKTVAVGLTLLSLALHLRFVTHAGGLWRDEANSVWLANVASVTEIWRYMEYDSFPVLYFALLRGWSAIVGQENDLAFRVLGGIIGVGILGAVWLNARAFRVRYPVLAIALVGLNPIIIRYGDSTRAYGLGILLMLLTLWSFRRLVEFPRPSSLRIWSAGVLALLAVHSLYYNSVMLLTISAGAGAIVWRRREWRTVALILGIGMIAAASLSVYVPMMWRMHEWTFLVSHVINLSRLWQGVGEVIGSPDPMLIWVWAGLVVVGLVLAAVIGSKDLRAKEVQGVTKRSLPAGVLFAATSLAVALPVYGGFLWVLSYHTQPWYFITVVAFTACCLEVIYGGWSDQSSPKLVGATLGVRLMGAILVFGFSGFATWEEVGDRQTNIDLVAGRLKEVAGAGDVILLSQWEEAVSLGRYYQGPAAIVTVPPIRDHHVHRYDLLLEEMKKKEALAPVFEKMKSTLQSGHTVWLAGGLLFVKPGQKPLTLPPNFDLRKSSLFCYVSWWQQTGFFIQSHARGLARGKTEERRRTKGQWIRRHLTDSYPRVASGSI